MQTENRDEVRERIIEAALKRFTHYSASKTTMNEIADDLHCSKASLYYYFPDKNALHLSVLEKAGEAYFVELETAAAGKDSAYEALMEMITIRHAFGKRFCRLELFKVLRDKQILNSTDIFKYAREREAQIVTNIIRKGVENGELETEEPEKVATLYIQSMVGLRFSMSHNGMSDDISDEEFETVREWQIMLADIFIKGLKK